MREVNVPPKTAVAATSGWWSGSRGCVPRPPIRICVCVRSGLSTKNRCRPTGGVGSVSTVSTCGPSGSERTSCAPNVFASSSVMAAGEADDHVRLDEAARVGGEHLVAGDGLDAGGSARGGPRVGWPAKSARPPEGETRERAIIVAGLEQLGDGLALEAGELVGIERGRAEDAADELDERLEIPADDLAVEADRRGADVEPELAAQAVDRALDLRGGHALHPRRIMRAVMRERPSLPSGSASEPLRRENESDTSGSAVELST